MNYLPQDQVFWYLKYPITPALKQNIKADVVIIGGGMAGLSAAQSFVDKNLSVVLLEKTYCGAGASGKSSGFITPDSELSLSDLISLHGSNSAIKLWDFVINGVNLIEDNIKKFNLDCDYQKQDTLILAQNNHAFRTDIKKEYESRKKFNFDSVLYQESDLELILGSKNYKGGISYSNTFGIQAYRYCQEIKKILIERGVQVYEETPVIKINKDSVQTYDYSISAKYIVVCVDRFLPELEILNTQNLANQIYHAQTFLLISKPLSDQQVNKIFPKDKFMVWDTDLIYQYYRITGDNRLMLGGASLLYTYAKYEIHNSAHIFNKLTKYFAKKFPELDINFEYIWPGLIGVTKDILPIAGQDKNNSNIFYISGAAGLPWAAALGRYSAQVLLENKTDLNEIFSPYRNFFLGNITQKLLGTRLTFALSHLLRINKVV